MGQVRESVDRSPSTDPKGYIIISGLERRANVQCAMLLLEFDSTPFFAMLTEIFRVDHFLAEEIRIERGNDPLPRRRRRRRRRGHLPLSPIMPKTRAFAARLVGKQLIVMEERTCTRINCTVSKRPFLI